MIVNKCDKRVHKRFKELFHLHLLFPVLNPTPLILWFPFKNYTIVISNKDYRFFGFFPRTSRWFFLAILNEDGCHNKKCLGIGWKEFSNILKSVKESIPKFNNPTNFLSHVISKQFIVTFNPRYFVRVTFNFFIDRLSKFLNFVITWQDFIFYCFYFLDLSSQGLVSGRRVQLVSSIDVLIIWNLCLDSFVDFWCLFLNYLWYLFMDLYFHLLYSFFHFLCHLYLLLFQLMNLYFKFILNIGCFCLCFFGDLLNPHNKSLRSLCNLFHRILNTKF